MTDEQTAAARSRKLIVSELYELIAALDRRVPRVAHVGEVAIARAAAVLRVEAVRRIATLEDEARADATAARFEPTAATAWTQ
jgi:hypothetical protein